jgi:hypothetical protein
MRKPGPRPSFLDRESGDSFLSALSRNLSNAFRRPEMADEPINYVSSLDIQRQNGAVQGSRLPGFRRTASDRPNPGYSDRSVSIRVKLLSAYTPVQPVTDRRMFAGRIGIMNTLIHAVEEQRQHVVIYGERGVGKSSLLQLISQAAKDARYLVAYIDCGQRSEFGETFRALAATIPLMYHSGYGPTSPESERGDTLADLLGPEPVTVGTAVEALSKIEGTRVLLILDDFDRTGSADFRDKIAELLKSLSDQAMHVQALIAGVPTELAELVGHVPSLHRNVLAMRIPRMTAAEIRDIIVKGEAASEVRFDDEAVQTIIAACTGLPYLAKLICYRAAPAAFEDGRRTVNAADVGASLQDAIEDLRKTVPRQAQLRIDELTQRGQLGVLGALARAAQSTGGWFTMDDIALAVGEDPTPHGDAPALARSLVERNILIEATNDAHEQAFRFAAPTLPDYLALLVARGRSAPRIASRREA